nr:bifunctional tRNA (5-methylaminomethyl-2-thiouridine)(34)-methyltransferase MnmD/FAD-dependent 5-carboxymethylaminomethyl-2-thiouridine(34) oxidoreductase MnmC [Dechloromonas sp.]
MSGLQPAHLSFTADGTPRIPGFDDVDFSAHGLLNQAHHVFLDGNDLPARWQGHDRFVILETSFGLGLDFLATWQAWQADPQRCRRLHFIALEQHPFSATDLAIAHRAWPELADLATELHRRWPPLTPGIHRLRLAGGQLILTLVFGDATSNLRKLDAAVDAFYLDSPSPAADPALWTLSFCKGLSRLAAPGATLASGTLIEPVRDALAAAEFTVEQQPGFTDKRPMLSGRLRSRRPDRHPSPSDRRALIIGAGIAGCTTAYRMAAAGWQLTLLDGAPAPATGASCNLAGAFRPLPSADDNRLSRLTRAGFLATHALFAEFPGARWAACGALHLGRDAEHVTQQARAITALDLPSGIQQFVDAQTASEILGHPVAQGGWWFPNGGWVQPASICRAALAAFPERINCRFNAAIARLAHDGEQWQALDSADRVLASAPHVVIAAGAGATRLAQLDWLPQYTARGQVSHLPAELSAPIRTVVLGRQGYAIPEVDGLRLIGATSQEGDTDTRERLADHADNLEGIHQLLPGFATAIAPDTISGRVGLRPMSPDRLPIVGAVPDASRSGNRLLTWPRLPGLWCVQGFGARGIVWSALMADLLLSRIENDPLPLENDLVDALDPARFLIRPPGSSV